MLAAADQKEEFEWTDGFEAEGRRWEARKLSNLKLYRLGSPSVDIKRLANPKEREGGTLRETAQRRAELRRTLKLRR